MKQDQTLSNGVFFTFFAVDFLAQCQNTTMNMYLVRIFQNRYWYPHLTPTRKFSQLGENNTPTQHTLQKKNLVRMYLAHDNGPSYRNNSKYPKRLRHSNGKINTTVTSAIQRQHHYGGP